MNDNKIRAALFKFNCDWVEFRANEPKESHFGGILKSQIRTITGVLNGLMQKNSTCLDRE